MSFPRRLLVSLTEAGMNREDRKAAPDAITMRKLAPTIHYEGALIAEMGGTVDAFRTVATDVLILGGSKGLPFLEPGRDALARTLPHSRRVEFPGLDHGASSDPSTTNPGGKPEIVGQIAREVLFLLRHPQHPSGDEVKFRSTAVGAAAVAAALAATLAPHPIAGASAHPAARWSATGPRRCSRLGIASEVTVAAAGRPRRPRRHLRLPLTDRWSPSDDAERGKQHQDEGGDSQQAVEDDDRQREVPFRGDNTFLVSDGPGLLTARYTPSQRAAMSSPRTATAPRVQTVAQASRFSSSRR